MGPGVKTKPGWEEKAVKDPTELENIQGLGSELRKNKAEIGTHHDNQDESGERATRGKMQGALCKGL